ncbi:MAG: hypothetical protein AAFU61_17820, partial [Pseudomonadota bacterium]
MSDAGDPAPVGRFADPQARLAQARAEAMANAAAAAAARGDGTAEDGALDPPLAALRTWALDAGVRAAALFELRSGGRRTGALTLSARRPRRIGPGLRAALGLLAGHAGGWAAA